MITQSFRRCNNVLWGGISTINPDLFKLNIKLNKPNGEDCGCCYWTTLYYNGTIIKPRLTPHQNTASKMLVQHLRNKYEHYCNVTFFMHRSILIFFLLQYNIFFRVAFEFLFSLSLSICILHLRISNKIHVFKKPFSQKGFSLAQTWPKLTLIWLLTVLSDLWRDYNQQESTKMAA